MNAETQPTRQRLAPARRVRPVLAAGLALVAGVVVLAALYGGGKVIRNEWFPFLIWMAVPAVLVHAMWIQRGRVPVLSMRRRLPLVVLTVLTLAYLFSSTVRHSWFYFLQWGPESSPELRNTGLVRFAFWTVLLTPCFALGIRKPWWLILLVLGVAEVASIHALLETTQGAALYRTDHPSLMFRIWEFAHSFPRLSNYVPMWNGGVADQTSVTTGVAGPGLLLWPLWHWFPVHAVYTYAWALLFLVITPWLGVFAVRVMGGDRTSALVGGLLALCVSQQAYLWAMHYGTIGSAFDMALAMPVCALGFRVIWQGRREWWAAVALVVCGFGLLLWPPGALVAGAVGLAAVLSADRWTWRKVGCLAACSAAIVLLFLPWLDIILHEGQSVLQFVTAHGHPGSHAENSFSLTMTKLATCARDLTAHVKEMHPLIIIFGFAGVVAGVDRRLRRWFLPILAVLAGITACAKQFMPHSQLWRMAIPLAMVGVLPAAILIGRLLRAHDPRFAVYRAAVVALLICTAINVAKITANRGLARYVTLSPQMQDFVAWARDDVEPGGRILFAGPCVHGYGAGNVAYLPILTGREMMAVDYYGFPPQQVRYAYPPREFTGSPHAMQTFLDAYNVSHVVTYHDNWKARLRAEPSSFSEIKKLDGISIFRRTAWPGLFHRGRGEVQAELNRLTVTLDDPQAEAVIAYNWMPGLQAPAGVELFAHPHAAGISLVGIRAHGQSPVAITYNSRAGREATQAAEASHANR